jgi:hypothetical protein
MAERRPSVTVTYVDRSSITATADQWRHIRSDGVDVVEVDGVRFEGKSIYWLYGESDLWVAGAASFYEDIKNPELVITPDGSQLERVIQWVPDISHADMKLGWWRG